MALRHIVVLLKCGHTAVVESGSHLHYHVIDVEDLQHLVTCAKCRDASEKK